MISNAENSLTLDTIDERMSAENIDNQRSLIDKFIFLEKAQLIDVDTHVRVESWIDKPHEIGSQTSEDTPGSYANSALKIFELLQ